MARIGLWFAVGLVCALSCSVGAQQLFSDSFADASAWKVEASDGVAAEIGPAIGGGLRLSYNFKAGNGFVVVRRSVNVKLPENYRLSMQVRGSGPANNFETKLLDPSGDNVWWVNLRDYLPSEQWTPEVFKRRHFTFAWGPSGGKPHETLGAIEFAVAASSGGAGAIEFANLLLEQVPASTPGTGVVTIKDATGTLDAKAAGSVMRSGGGVIGWKPGVSEGALALDLGGTREFGGVIAVLDRATGARVAVELALDGSRFEPAATVRVPAFGRIYVPIRDAEAAAVRITVAGMPSDAVVRTLELAPLEFGATKNGTFARIASDQHRGVLPRYLLNEQTYWTVMGVPGDTKEGLLAADGAIEVDKERFSVDPIIRRDSGEALTWANASITHELADGELPIPSVVRTHESLSLRVDAFAFGETGASVLAGRYTITNTGTKPEKGTLLLAVRPLQVNPPWQDLKTSGGYAPIDAIECSSDTMTVTRRRPADTKRLHVLGGSIAMHASSFDEGDAALRVLAGESLPSKHSAAVAADSGVIVCAYELAPGASKSWAVVVPLHDQATPVPTSLADLATAESQAKFQWQQALRRVGLSIPANRDLELAFRTVQGHILVNSDGPAIQPGSRTYERSWIRDGSLTSSALLATGHAAEVARFIDWYGPYQYPSGKIPCVVDKRGSDPVPEHDSHGQFIYLLWKYYRFTGDRAMLERHYDRVVKTVEYIRSIRAERMTPEYAQADGLLRAKYGLVPESISHEGYSAKPMHSYWDGFFVEKGLQDAASIAKLLGREADAASFAQTAGEYRASMLDSIARARAFHKTDYVPGCVELGDFDATSTTVALWPCNADLWLPREPLVATFDRVYKFSMGRIDGTQSYREYTPYEWRIVGAMVRLDRADGWRERAWDLATFYMNDRRPLAWNQWGEIVWKDAATPRFIGDMPHTWCGSDFLNSVRTMFVYEEDEAERLVFAAGVPVSWLDQGVSIKNWPTVFGVLSYELKRSGEAWTLTYDLRDRDGKPTQPKGGITLALPRGSAVESLSLDGVAAKVETTPGRIKLPAAGGTAVVRFRAK
ncbi:MAG TPA: hypothetical protein VF777_00365 [Phycisphaerales bacterium]